MAEKADRKVDGKVLFAMRGDGKMRGNEEVIGPGFGQIVAQGVIEQEVPK